MSERVNILVVEDEVNIRTALIALLEKQGYSAAGAATGEEALSSLQERPVSLVITDLKMPGMDGVAVIRRVKEQWPDTEVVVITAYGSIESAVEAMRSGAYDYITKPIDRDRFRIVVDKAIDRHQLAVENRQLRDRLETRARFDEMVGDSEPMRRVYHLVEMVAPSDVTVLLLGESGTGKELVAKAIHHKSQRADGPFVAVNCGALPENLFESELFGYEKGAFTGATATKIGRLEMAEFGTLFLDEVAELPLKSQVDFLRVLEAKEFRRLGGTRPIKMDARVIAATNRDLKDAVEEGSFREDLYYRLNVIPVQLPKLQDRPDDIPLLVEHFLREFCTSHDRNPKEMSHEAMRLLRLYSWPGNIRQLRNIVERLVVTIPESTIEPRHLPAEVQQAEREERTVVVRLGMSLEEVEREVIRRTLAEMTHHREKAANILGISPRALHYKIKQYGIKE